MASLNVMVKRVAGLQGTKDLNDWEEKFVANIVRDTKGGDNTTSLTEPQITALERIFNKHFFC